ncbi:MAG: carboxypeptidase regulatory-like domain-containing protein, partial [Holophagales bacterium]|nr:carboxypeptidase regulatory-like domain-containing protein [Holophagales bacterium]
MAPGTWDIQARLFGSARTLRIEVEVLPEQQELEADMIFEDPGPSLEGQVLHNGRPAAGAEIWPGAIFADVEGRFRIEGLGPGPYQIGIRGPWGSYRYGGDLSAASFVTIEIETRRVKGRLLDSDGHPVPGARISSTKADGSYDGRSSAETDEAGRFVLPVVQVGSHRLFARASGLGVTSRRLEVLEDLDGLELRLRRPGSLIVHARRTDGKAVEYLTARASGEDGSAIWTERGEIRTEGVFHLDEIPRGTWDLRLGCSGCVPTFARATLPGTPLEVVFEPGTQLVATVPSLNGSKVAAEIHLRDAEGMPVSFRRFGYAGDTKPLERGKVWVHSLPAGTWSLEVRTEDGRTFTGQATTT